MTTTTTTTSTDISIELIGIMEWARAVAAAAHKVNKSLIASRVLLMKASTNYPNLI